MRIEKLVAVIARPRKIKSEGRGGGRCRALSEKNKGYLGEKVGGPGLGEQ